VDLLDFLGGSRGGRAYSLAGDSPDQGEITQKGFLRETVLCGMRGEGGTLFAIDSRKGEGFEKNLVGLRLTLR